MSPVDLQTSVAEKIKALYAISQKLEQLFPGRYYTPDGHMIGISGEPWPPAATGWSCLRRGQKTTTPK